MNLRERFCERVLNFFSGSLGNYFVFNCATPQNKIYIYDLTESRFLLSVSFFMSLEGLVLNAGIVLDR